MLHLIRFNYFWFLIFIRFDDEIKGGESLLLDAFDGNVFILNVRIFISFKSED